MRGEEDECEQREVSQRNVPQRGRESEREITQCTWQSLSEVGVVARGCCALREGGSPVSCVVATDAVRSVRCDVHEQGCWWCLGRVRTPGDDIAGKVAVLGQGSLT